MSMLKRVDDVADKENIFHRTNVPAPNDGKHTARTVAQRSPTHRVQHRGTLILSVDESRDNPDETLTLTVDSGAAENVIGQHMCPGTAMKASAESRCGVQYTTADRNSMPNRGEKDVKVETGEGQKCVLKMQVTGVTKALMSCGSSRGVREGWRIHRARSHNDSNSVQKRGWCPSDEGEAR